MRLFFFFIFISMLIIGCSETESSKRCEGDDGNYESIVKINKYYSFNKYHLYIEEEFDNSKNKTEYHSYDVYFKEILELIDDSTFKYNAIWAHYSDSNKKEIVSDTVEYMSGTFAIRPVDGEKWHSFVLKSDSIFIRWSTSKKKNDVSHLIIDEQYFSDPFIANEDSVLLNVDLQDSCFTLAHWYQEPDDISFSCSDPYASTSRIFCANATMKDSSIVGVVKE